MRKLYADTGNSERKFNEVTVESAFVQFYISASRLIYGLKSQCSLYLLIWALREMSDYNQVILNKGNRSSFLADIRMSGKKYSDSSVRAAISELTESGLMVSMSDEGKRESLYMINPIHFWKTRSQKDRGEVIQAFINLMKQKNERDTI